MIQVTPHTRILVAIEPADFRKGIDGLARLCRTELEDDPFCGTMFVFRNRRKTALKLLVFDGQGMWLAQKRMSSGKFGWWPRVADAGRCVTLEAHELVVLLRGGDPSSTRAAPQWRKVGVGSSTSHDRAARPRFAGP